MNKSNYSSPSDILVNRISLFVLVITWILMVVAFYYLPSRIPAHFNMMGVADAIEDKWLLLIFPCIMVIVYFGINFLNKHPEVHNQAVKVSPANQEQLYGSSIRFFNVIRLMILAGLMIIFALTVSVAFHWIKALGWWFLPIVICMWISPTIYYLRKSFLQIKNESLSGSQVKPVHF